MKTSTWVLELLDVWIGVIKKQETLDDIITKCEARKKTLGWDSPEDTYTRMVKAYNGIARGTEMSVLRGLPTQDGSEGSPTNKRKASHYQKCRFYHWHPRKHVLWVSVEWETKRKSARKAGSVNLIGLNRRAIQRYQPIAMKLSERVANMEQWKSHFGIKNI